MRRVLALAAVAGLVVSVAACSPEENRDGGEQPMMPMSIEHLARETTTLVTNLNRLVLQLTRIAAIYANPQLVTNPPKDSQ